MPGVPITGKESLGIGHGAVEPTQSQTVGPDWDPNLIAAEKGNSGADAMNCRPVAQMLLQIQAEPLLRSPAHS